MMARDRSGSVRMGPISIFTLVIVVCLAVMAVLSLTTARADAARAERQAAFTRDDYANETAAQTLVAEIDAVLAGTRTQDKPASEGAAAIEARLADMTKRAEDAGRTAAASTDAPQADDTAGAAADGGANDPEGTDAPNTAIETSVDGTTVTAHIEQTSKRCLDIALVITPDAELRVVSWKPSTTWTEDTSDTLWMGA